MTTRVRFDGWILSPATGELWRDGRRRRLQPQGLQVLLALLRRPGEVVTREALTAHLWTDAVVDYDAGLNAIVRKLRIALEDDVEIPRFIETVPRCGYRYIGTPPSDVPDGTAAPLSPGPDGSSVAGPATDGAGSRATMQRPASAGASWRPAMAIAVVAFAASSSVWYGTSLRPAAPMPALPEAQAAVILPAPTANPSAFDAYLKARLAYRDGDWLAAADQASAAISRDAAFGPAYLTRAAAGGMAIVFNVDASEARLADMRRDLQHAAGLMGRRDPMFTAVDAMYTSIGDRDHARALSQFADAQAAGLSDPTLLRTRAMQQVVVNRLDEAIAAHRALAALDPGNFVLVNMTAVLLSFDRRPAEALRMSRLVRERFPEQPLAELTHARLVFAYSAETAPWRQAFARAAARLTPEQRVIESFDLLRFERRERELLQHLPTEREAVVSAGMFNSLPLCCVGTRPIAQYRGWAALLTGDAAGAAREGYETVAFARRAAPTRWNDWYLQLLEAEGLLMANRRQQAVAGARAALTAVERANNMVHWRYAAAIAARVFAWGGDVDGAVAVLEQLERARPGLRPAEITDDPFYRVPLERHRGYQALCARLRHGMATIER